MLIDRQQIHAATERYKKRTPYREANLRQIHNHNYLGADTPERVDKFLERRELSRQEAAEMLSEQMPAPAPGLGPVGGEGVPNPLERILGTSDLMGVDFLERGLRVARTVGRIWVVVAGGRPDGYGTGFMISPRLLLTNNHVLGSKPTARKSLVELNYQLGIDGKPLQSTSFEFDPDTFFFTDQHLDYTVIAVRQIASDGRELGAFGWTPLIEGEGKAIISQWMNIIQHPNGEVKALSLRENQLVDVFDEFIHYQTDTAQGSSGSPVFNDRWEVVGLHHSGVWEENGAGQILDVNGQVWNESMGEHRIKWKANEGVRVSRLIPHLRNQPMSGEQRRLFDEIFTAPPASREAVERLTPIHTPVNNSARATVTPDGAVTWTIPLSVSVRLGDGAAAQPKPAEEPATVAARAAAIPPIAPASAITPVGIDPQSILTSARRELGARTDVLNVRLGYVFRDGWITNERALVVTVRQRQPPAALREARITALPETYLGLPVEVTNPSVEDLMAQAVGPAASEAVFAAPATLREEITYTPVSGTPLKQVNSQMRVVAHVSPDAGWSQLSDFLGATNKRLVVGMYDFGAPHIADAVEAAGEKASFNKLTLVMQRGESVGEGTKADDLTDDQVVEQLGDALGGKFENAWVKIGRVNGWVASSYHIKVAVRDQKAFWLSSGNWQSSNQPNGDPLGEEPPRRMWLDKYNREWNAVVENSALAKLLETYLLHDFQNNLRADGFESLEFKPPNLPDLLIPEEFFMPSASERTGQFRYFQPFDENRAFIVTPLLTPDNYHDEALKLVESAEEELLIQNQTFNAPKQDQVQLRELIDAVIAKQHAGVSVRVIFRILFPAKARKVIEELKEYGFDTASLKVQKNCHTKGIIVDRKKVLLGSQNWSSDGVSVNRDASLLFEDKPLAKYFANIFDHDWNNIARQNIGSERLPIERIAADEKTPPGFVRLNWKDYLEML